MPAGNEPLPVTEYVADDDPFAPVPRFPNPLRQPWRAVGWLGRVGFGLASLVLLLAVLAAIPIVNFVVLGYLLQAEGRIARSGRIRDAFPLLELAPRLGSIALGFFVWLLPLALLGGAARDARLVDPDSPATGTIGVVTAVAALLVAVHLLLALARGGRLSCFFRPIRNVRWLLPRLRSNDYWDQASANVVRFVTRLGLRENFWRGVRGFGVAAAWLLLPTILFAALNDPDAARDGGRIAVTVAGGVLLAVVFQWVPFLQARFAAEDRFRAGFELRTIRRLFRHAPLCWLLALLAVYVLTLPLYLLKVYAPPQDAMWFLTTVFVLSIYPARLVTGWAYHQAVKRERPAHVLWRWGCRLLILPLTAFYAFLLFFTQFVGEEGRTVLFEHHAFLLPAPF